MKIVEHSSNRLTLSFGFVNFAFFVYLIFIGLFLFCIYNSTKQFTLVLSHDKSNVNCEINHDFLGIVIKKDLIKNVKQAKLVERKDNHGNIVYDVMIIAENRQEILSFNVSDKTRVVDGINSYIKNNGRAQNAYKSNPDWWFSYLLIAFLIVFFWTPLTEGAIVECTFDKSINQLILVFKTMFRKRVKKYPLEKINEIKIVEDKDSEGDKVFRPTLIIEGKKFNLCGSGNYKETQDMIELIKDFLRGNEDESQTTVIYKKDVISSSDSKEASPVTVLIIGLLITAYGIFLFLSGLKSEKWILTTGKVNYAEVIYDSENDNVKIIYEYTVNGIRYKNDTVSFGDSSPPGRKEIERLMTKYSPAGKEIDVYYDPERPWRSVLEPGNSFRSFLPLIVGIFVLFIGVFRIVKEYKKR